MPASKKRIKLRATSTMQEQKVPAALRDWVHIWHGVGVQTGKAENSTIFHAGSRIEELPFWKQFIRLPSNSLFPRVITYANPRKPYKDFLYLLLNMRWPMLFTVLLGVFLANIFIFALFVCFVCGEPSSFLGAFDLSYQTFTTIGFGVIFPERSCSNVMITIESFASMLVTSAIAGLVFAKFAKPKGKVAFSKVCVVQPYGKKYLALVVRVANATRSHDVTHDVIMEASFKLNLLRVEHKPPNDQQWQTQVPPNSSTVGAISSSIPSSGNSNNTSTTIDSAPLSNISLVDSTKSLSSYNLPLLQNNFITFRMGVAVVHLINEESPFFGMTEQDIAESDMVLEVSMSGVDSTLQDTVAERFTYTAADLKWGYRFTELLDFNEKRMEVIMDFAKLSTIESAPIDAVKYIHRPPMTLNQLPINSSTSKPASHPNTTTTTNGMNGDWWLRQRPASATALNHRILDSIDETPTEFSESFTHRQRLSSGESSVGSARQLRKASSKCSLAMEPLYEPLLQPSVGTQRLHKAIPVDRARTQRVQSGPSAPERDQGGVPANADRINNNGNWNFAIPTRQKQRLQHQLAGGAMVNQDDESTLSEEDDDVNEDVDEEEDAEVKEAGEDKAQKTLSRGKSMHRTRSALSIDVEDTPRFIKIAPIHIPKSYDFMRLYHSALYVGWPKIILVFVLSFIGINAVFGLVYWFEMRNILSNENVHVSNYELAFYMSVHTLATIGYGSIAPKTESVYMNFWVLVESSLGIIAVTIITGISWSKFARPRAHIHFSRKIVLSRIYGHRCLVFRAANARHSGDVHENFFRIGVILTNRKTGLRQMYDVPLVTAEWPSIKLPATLIHIVDELSPFYKFQSMEDLLESRVAVIVLLTGLDMTFSENVYARKMYFWDDFECNMQFADFALVERDRVLVDFEKFDQLNPQWDVYVPGHEHHQTPPESL